MFQFRQESPPDSATPDFEDNEAIREYLDMHKGSDLSLRKGCLEQLKTVITQRGIDDVTLGVTYGEDPEEFRDSVILRSCISLK